MSTPNPELVEKNKLANYKKQMKHDIEILKMDADFWEYKFKGLHYRNEYAKLSADLENFQAAIQEQMKEQLLKEQGDLQATSEDVMEKMKSDSE